MLRFHFYIITIICLIFCISFPHRRVPEQRAKVHGEQPQRFGYCILYAAHFNIEPNLQRLLCYKQPHRICILQHNAVVVVGGAADAAAAIAAPFILLFLHETIIDNVPSDYYQK